MAQRLAVVNDRPPEVVMVSPTMASEWLAHNEGNRHIRRSYVEQLKRSLVAGNWTASTDAIGFDVLGRLVNGQHRLTAIAESGVSVPLLVVHGLPAGARLNLDVGVKRSFSDYLTLERGEIHTAAMAAIVTFTMQLTEKGYRAGALFVYPSVSELLAQFDSDPERYRLAAGNAASKHWRTALLSPSIVGGLFFRFSEISLLDAEDFFEGFVSGQGLSEGSPILALRSQLIGRSRSRSLTVPPRIAIAWTIRAWNAYRKGETRQVLKWAAGDAYPIPE